MVELHFLINSVRQTYVPENEPAKKDLTIGFAKRTSMFDLFKSLKNIRAESSTMVVTKCFFFHTRTAVLEYCFLFFSHTALGFKCLQIYVRFQFQSVKSEQVMERGWNSLMMQSTWQSPTLKASTSFMIKMFTFTLLWSDCLDMEAQSNIFTDCRNKRTTMKRSEMKTNDAI